MVVVVDVVSVVVIVSEKEFWQELVGEMFMTLTPYYNVPSTHKCTDISLPSPFLYNSRIDFYENWIMQPLLLCMKASG